jgi:1-acyl-sn-glycerol-3-phosphate acyltransferase
VAVARRRLGFWRRFAVCVVKPLMILLTKRTWTGAEHIPRDGGVILAVNHLSESDPLVVAHFVYDAGRWPQFLAKSSLFQVPLLGPFLRWVRQLPVYRGTADAAKSLDAAAAAVKAGDGVIIYPEGTTPKQGELWPERGKTGVARLFLATGVPVVPIVTWGPQRLFDPRTRKMRLVPRTPVTVLAGPPVDLTKWADAEPTSANLHAITAEIMEVLGDLLSQARGEPAPGSSGAKHGERSSGRAQPEPGFGGGEHGERSDMDGAP